MECVQKIQRGGDIAAVVLHRRFSIRVRDEENTASVVPASRREREQQVAADAIAQDRRSNRIRNQ